MGVAEGAYSGVFTCSTIGEVGVTAGDSGADVSEGIMVGPGVTDCPAGDGERSSSTETDGDGVITEDGFFFVQPAKRIVKNKTVKKHSVLKRLFCFESSLFIAQ